MSACSMVICQPANSFRALCGNWTGWTGSSATPSYGSLFGRSYGMKAFRLSPGLTSRNRKGIQHGFLILNFVFIVSLPTFSVLQFMPEACLLIQTLDLSLLCLGGSGRWIFSGGVPFPVLTEPQALCRVQWTLVLPAFMFWLGGCEAVE